VADKNFKVKSGLQVPSLTTAGPVTTDASGNVTSTAALPLSQGGTGQTTAGNALNALLPLQTGNTNKYLQSNGVSTQWNAVTQQTVTDALAGTNIYTGITAPSSPTTGDIWIDNTTGNGIQLVRWRKTIASGTSTISGLDDNNLTLSYTAGNEQVYINGVLITRGQDYTATNGTLISLTQAVEVGDTVEIFGNPLFSVTDTYTQSQANSLYVAKSGFDAAGKNYCINGGMDIWQRGTSFSNAGGGQYTADRWQVYNAGGSYTAARTTSNIPVNFNYGIAVTATANGSIPYIMQMVETMNIMMLMGKNIIMGAWVHAPAGVTMNIQVLSSTTVDASIYQMNGNVTGTSSFTATGSPQFIYTNPGIMASNVKSLRLDIWPSSLSNGQTYTVTGVQLEASTIPTPFSRAAATIQGELAACQRYFVRYEKTGGNQTYFASGNVISATRTMVSLPLPVNMRTSPSIARNGTVSIYNNGSNYNITAMSVYQSTQNILNLDTNVSSGLTSNTSAMLSLASNGDYIDFSAEL
jgi:hypothetical protein